MHNNFYHWHSRAELKPDAAILEKRWAAAVNALGELGAPEVQSLLRLVLFPGAEPEFAKRFSEEIVKLEPTFPPDNNAELLRVMATAAVYEQFDELSIDADALALGIRAANFGGHRTDPVCKEILARADEYLHIGAERVRPAVMADVPPKLEQEAGAQIEALKKEAADGNAQAIANATAEVGSKLLNTLRIYRGQWEKLMEESQFLWWLIGRRSAQLQSQRESLRADFYAFPAAAEAAERVALLPPAPSIESLLEEVLAQCKPTKNGEGDLQHFIAEASPLWARGAARAAQLQELTPIASLLGVRATEAKIDPKSWKPLRVTPKMKLSPAAAATQYFRELMFLRALNELS